MKPQNLESAIVDKTAAILLGNDSAVPAIDCYSLRHMNKNIMLTIVISNHNSWA